MDIQYGPDSAPGTQKATALFVRRETFHFESEQDCNHWPDLTERFTEIEM